MEGDSIFAGVTNGGATPGNYLADIIGSRSYFSNRVSLTNYSTPSHQINSIISDYPSQVYSKRPSVNGGKRTIYLLLIGTNNNPPSAPTLLAHTAAAMADGFEVWLCTLLPRGTGNGNQWDAFNRALRESDAYDKLIDFNLLFRDASNPGLMGDGLHPTNLGYIFMADYLNGRAWSDQKREGIAIGSLGKQSAESVAITGGTLTGVAVTATGGIQRTSTGALLAGFSSQAFGAGSSKQWTFGHEPNAAGNLPMGAFRFDYYNGSSWDSALCGFGPDGRVIGKQIRLTSTPTYASDAAADADLGLLSGQVYMLNGSRAIYRKP